MDLLTRGASNYAGFSGTWTLNGLERSGSYTTGPERPATEGEHKGDADRHAERMALLNWLEGVSSQVSKELKINIEIDPKTVLGGGLKNCQGIQILLEKITITTLTCYSERELCPRCKRYFGQIVKLFPMLRVYYSSRRCNKDLAKEFKAAWEAKKRIERNSRNWF